MAFCLVPMEGVTPEIFGQSDGRTSGRHFVVREEKRLDDRNNRHISHFLPSKSAALSVHVGDVNIPEERMFPRDRCSERWASV